MASTLLIISRRVFKRLVPSTISLKIVLVRIHQWSISVDMEKELLGLSPGIIDVISKRLSKGTNPRYEKEYTSLLRACGLGASRKAILPYPCSANERRGRKEAVV
jgi:hypothetical protein